MWPFGHQVERRVVHTVERVLGSALDAEAQPERLDVITTAVSRGGVLRHEPEPGHRISPHLVEELLDRGDPFVV